MFEDWVCSQLVVSVYGSLPAAPCIDWADVGTAVVVGDLSLDSAEQPVVRDDCLLKTHVCHCLSGQHSCSCPCIFASLTLCSAPQALPQLVFLAAAASPLQHAPS